MTKITIQRDATLTEWFVEEDDAIVLKIRDKNGSRTSGQRQAQRELADLIMKRMEREAEDAHRIAYLAVELVQESQMAITFSLSRLPDETRIGN